MTMKGNVRKVGRSTRVGTLLPLATTVALYGDTDKLQHDYVRHYERHLGHRRLRRNRLLEIGVGGYEQSQVGGGSLRVWRDYLPLSRIVGFDLHEKVVELGSRVGFVQGDQGNEADLARAVEALGGPPDVVIDDGSHLVDHARLSFQYLFPLMPSGGLYVVEDTSTSYGEGWGGGIPAPDGTAIGLAKDLVDATQVDDPTYTIRPDWPRPEHWCADAKALHVYPGIFFIEKR